VRGRGVRNQSSPPLPSIRGMRSRSLMPMSRVRKAFAGFLHPMFFRHDASCFRSFPVRQYRLRVILLFSPLSFCSSPVDTFLLIFRPTLLPIQYELPLPARGFGCADLFWPPPFFPPSSEMMFTVFLSVSCMGSCEDRSDLSFYTVSGFRHHLWIDVSTARPFLFSS